MGRYDWPGELAGLRDQYLLRNEFNVLQTLFNPLEFMEQVMLARAAYLAALSESDADLWLPIGPSTMINGQASGSPKVAGRIRDIKINETGDRAYAASANGGIWYTDDAGASWQPLGSWGLYPDATALGGAVQSLTFGALDVTFGQNGDGSDNSALDVVYAASGEGTPVIRSYPGGKHGGVGVLRIEGTVDEALDAVGGNPWKREAPNLTGAGTYRLTHNPEDDLDFDSAGSNTLVAATSRGLYSRSGAFVEDADWTRISGNAPFDFAPNSGVICSDVLWTKATTAAPVRPSRLWVTVVDPIEDDPTLNRTAVYWSTSGPTGRFTKINLPDARPGGRIGLAASPSDPGVVYALGTLADKKAQLWRINPELEVHKVENTPIAVFGKPLTDSTTGNISIPKDQADYDLAITVDSANHNIVYVGGSIARRGGTGLANASLYKLTISEPSANNFQTDFTPGNQGDPATDPTFLGTGTHPDVHALTLGPNGLWVGCDGGVFRRQAGNSQSLNSGLSVAEPGFVASHPTLDGPCIAGCQDNGRIERVGDTLWHLWKKADGGGVAYHPIDPKVYMGQIFYAQWNVNSGAFIPPVFRSDADRNKNRTNSENSESEKASFYSAPAVASGEKILEDNSVDPDTQGNARLVVGTNRIWYTENWNPRPRATTKWVTLPTNSDARGTPPNDSQDILAQSGSDWVESIKWANVGDPKTSFNGAKLLILTYYSIRQFTFDLASNKWLPHIFTDEKRKNRITSNSDIPDGATAILPRVGRWTDIAPHDSGREDHGSFYISCTGHSRISSTGAIVESDKMDTLWWFDGKDKFHPTGLRNTPQNTTTGTSGSKAPAYAVLVDPDHPEIVYVGNAMGVWKGTLSFSGTDPQWEWRGLLNGLPQTVVQDLSFHKSGNLALLRAALQSRGVWELDVSDTPRSVGRTYLRAHNLDTRRVEIVGLPTNPLDNLPTLQPANFAQSPDIYVHRTGDALPWNVGLPNEADLFAQTEILRKGPLTRVAPALFDTFVLVHHRHTRRLPATQARVLLLQLNNAPKDLTTVALGGTWAQAVVAIFGGGNTAPAGWQIADAGNQVRSPSEKLDARTPRAIKFDADLSHGFVASARQDSVILLAIVTSTTDVATEANLTEPNLEQLLRKSGHVAARRIRRRA